MNRKPIFLFLGFLFCFLPHDLHATCNFQSNAKACPTSGTTLLDETYPAAAFVISINTIDHTDASKMAQNNFIYKVLESYEFAENSPPVIIPTEQEEFDKLRDYLKEKIKLSNGKISEKILEKIIHAPAQNYRWQQDYFESFVNLKTGNPELRRMASYVTMDEETTSTLAKSGEICNISEGEILKTGEPTKNGMRAEMGGNIEGLPGGLCLVGKYQKTNFTSQFCGQDNSVSVETTWLKVGHVDEIIKVIPSHRPEVPAECNFTLMFASPQKALDLLLDRATASFPFFNIDSINAKSSASEVDAFKTSRSSSAAGRTICRLYNKHILPLKGADPQKAEKKNGAKRAYLFIKHLFMNQAMAQMTKEEIAESSLGEKCPIDTISNFEFRDAVLAEYKEYNKLVQTQMNTIKKQVTEKILSRLPQCGPYISIVDVPNLFFGTSKVNEDGSESLPQEGDARSFMPNPANSVMANKTLIFPDPQNNLFRDYLTTQMEKNGLKSTFVDSWDFAHTMGGNLHCASHTIPYCRPVKTEALLK